MHRDGHRVWVSMSIAPLRDEDGRIVGASIIARGIDAEKAARDALTVARERFATAFENAPIGMALIGADGNFQQINPACCELLDRSPVSLLGTGVQAVTHVEDVAADLEHAGAALAGGSTGYELEKRYLRPDGSVIWASVKVSLVRDGAGAPQYFVTQVQDVSERKRAEEQVRAYTKELRDRGRRDAVTGLLTPPVFADELAARRDEQRGPLAVVILGLDGAASDSTVPLEAVLERAALASAAACRDGDVLGRVGSAEIALALPGLARVPAGAVVARLRAALEELDVPRASFGVATHPEDGAGATTLLEAAGRARVASRREGGDGERLERAAELVTGVASEATVPELIARVLETARTELGMDVGYVARLTDTEQVFEAIEGDAASFGSSRGRLPLEAMVCRRMVNGEVECHVGDVAEDPSTRDLEVVAKAGVRAYVGVPLRFSDGRLYGTLCCLSHQPDPSLGERDVRFMRILSTLVSDQLEREELQAENRRLATELTGVNALLAALDARDRYTGRHSKTVVELSEAARHEVERAALLHDIGKVGIPDSILQKPAALDEAEWELMREHPAIGARIVASIPGLTHLAAAVRAEHERWDGAGYPEGLRGTEIPIASRIILACDAYHAMTSDRPYRAAKSEQDARAELGRHAGSQFDPHVVAALGRVLEAT